MGELKCPICNSDQLTANKKGFSGKKALAGAVVTGGIGLLAGTIGSNKIIITCLRCGHEFKAGDYDKEVEKNKKSYAAAKNYSNLPFIIIFLVVSIIGVIASYYLFINSWTILGIVFSIVTILCFYVAYILIKDELKTGNKDLKTEAKSNPIAQIPTSTPFVAKQKIKCSDCSEGNILQSKYCMSCGKKLDISTMQTVTNDNNFEFKLCTKCNQYTPSISKYCINCSEVM